MSDKKRARHVASDEAHAWARSLQLDNPNAKSVLRALTLYVNGEGSCFVSIEQLHEDTDLSMDTVRRRLVWLEQIGAIVRLPQWLDANGRRNSEGKGKRTTDDIRLLLNADIEEIEARAKGNSDEISPSSVPPQDFTADEVSPTVALGQPSQSCEVLISEPEPEDSPQSPPPGGVVDAIEGWKDFEADWGEPIIRQSIAQQVWAALKADERELARKAARGYAIWLKQQKRPPNRLGAQIFLKERDAWAKFAEIAPDSQSNRPAGAISSDSIEGRAIITLHAIAGIPRPFEGRNGIVYSGAITPQLLALAQASSDGWIDLNHQQDGAWQSFLKASISTWRPHHIARAPWPWPPRADGKTYTETTGPPSLMTEEDMATDL